MLETIQSPLIEPVAESELVTLLRATIDPDIELVQHRQLTGGLFNTSYYLATRRPDHKECESILRIAPSASKHDTLFDYEKHMMTAEPAVYDLMRDADIPVPEVIAIEPSGRVIPRHFMLLRYLDTIPMNDPTVPEQAKPALRRQLGSYLRQMHAITNDRFGRVQPEGNVTGDTRWRVVFGDLFAEATWRCRQHDLLKPETLTHAEHLFAAHAACFDDPAIQPALIHGDVWDANVLLAQNGTGDWQIAAIIDVDRALFADREFEAALWDNTPDFNAGYGQPLTHTPEAELRRQFYKLFHALFHIFVFGVQIPAATLHEDFSTRAYRLVGALSV